MTYTYSHSIFSQRMITVKPSSLTAPLLPEHPKSYPWSHGQELVFPLDGSGSKTDGGRESEETDPELNAHVSKIPMDRIRKYLQKEWKMNPFEYYCAKPRTPQKVIGFEVPNELKQSKSSHQAVVSPLPKKKSLLHGIRNKIERRGHPDMK